MTTPRRLALAARAVAALSAAAALVGTAGCAGPDSGPAAAPRQPASTGPSAHTWSGGPDFGGTDRAWIEVTIAMDEQLQPLLALVPQRAGDPEISSLAGQVQTLVDAELSTLRRLHDLAGLPAENPHEGMPMPGMVTPAELAQAATLNASDFDTLTYTKVKEYLAQGVNLAQSEAEYGVERQTRALAASGLVTRTQILTKLLG